MALALLSLIPGPARAALPFIQTGVGNGLSVDRIHAILGLAGIPISRSVLTSAIDYFHGEITAGRYIEALAGNVLPNPDFLQPALGLIRRQYSYIIRITGYDSATKRRLVTHTTVSSERLLSKAQVQEEARDLIGIDTLHDSPKLWINPDTGEAEILAANKNDVLTNSVYTVIGALKAGPYGVL